MTPLDRVLHALRRRDQAHAADIAVRDASAASARGHARAGRRQILVADGAHESLVEVFWDAIEAGDGELWIELSPRGGLSRDAAQGVVRLAEFAYELDRRLVINVPPGPERDALRRAGLSTSEHGGAP